MKKRILSSVLAVLMCAVVTFSLCACDETTNKADKTPTNTATADNVSVDPLWANATYLEDVALGEGKTTIEVKVEAGQKAVTVTINTDAQNLEDALTGVKLVEGDKGEFGLYIKKVNGILADYDTDSTYWAMYKDGEYLMTGAKDTEITSGDHYEIVRTK